MLYAAGSRRCRLSNSAPQALACGSVTRVALISQARASVADEEKIGRPWSDDELDAIVADYFAMLTAELCGQPYVKSHHSAALMAEIGRTHRSVEFKHQNISAVMEELGMPWIHGYKPKRNYQNAIFDAIDRYLTRTNWLGLPQLEQRPVAVEAAT